MIIKNSYGFAVLADILTQPASLYADKIDYKAAPEAVKEYCRITVMPITDRDFSCRDCFETMFLKIIQANNR